MQVAHLSVLVAFLTVGLLPGCSHDPKPYEPKAAWSGTPSKIPEVPVLSKKPIRVGDAYTVHGASHHLRSIVHSAEVKGKDITLIGWIVASNLADAPEWAVHPTGKADPEGKVSPLPSFRIADEKGDVKNSIKVVGWASNFAQVYDQLKKDKASQKDDEGVSDEFYGVKLPSPVPAIGAKVKITGNYDVASTRSTSGIESDPHMGILTYSKIEYLEPAAEPATLPGMK